MKFIIIASYITVAAIWAGFLMAWWQYKGKNNLTPDETTMFATVLGILWIITIPGYLIAWGGLYIAQRITTNIAERKENHI